jgi:hypothetical protein
MTPPTTGLKWYEYGQNNSGGRFHVTDRVSHKVYVEARSPDEANRRAQDLAGIYFDGCADGRDCSCCGDRWYSQEMWGGNDDGKEEFPTACRFGRRGGFQSGLYYVLSDTPMAPVTDPADSFLSGAELGHDAVFYWADGRRQYGRIPREGEEDPT